MDLIYTNPQKEDQGVLLDYELDMAFGASENSFECTISGASHCCQAGSYLYIEGTEYGGIVDGIQSKSATKEVIYSGRTWHGILGSKIILPYQEGEAALDGVTIKETDSAGNTMADKYLVISGDVNACLRFLISRIGLDDTFTAPDTPSGIDISAYQFYRYTDAYSGIVKMLASVGLKLKVKYTGGKAVLSAAAKYDYSQDQEFDSDLVEFDVTKSYKTVNHLICLGKGELEERLVVHLYADAEGNISQTQTQFGMDEYAATYEYSSIENEEELITNGKQQLQALWNQDKLSVDFDETMDNYDVGDVVGTLDNITGTKISAAITKKIITIRNGQINIDISTDSNSSSGSSVASSGGGGSGSTNTGSVSLETVYPIGSIYMSTTATNPAELFGFGVWVQIKDTFLLSAGDSYALGATGGEEVHTLTVDEIPWHNHRQTAVTSDGNVNPMINPKVTGTSAGAYHAIATWTSSLYAPVNTQAAGGSKPHNNMPPYLAVNVWQRTA